MSVNDSKAMHKTLISMIILNYNFRKDKYPFP